MVISLIGVPFDGMGREPGQAGVPAALRAAGLEAAFSSRDVVSLPDLMVPAPRAERARDSGLLNEKALLAMIEALHAELSESISAGQFPLALHVKPSAVFAWCAWRTNALWRVNVAESHGSRADCASHRRLSGLEPRDLQSGPRLERQPGPSHRPVRYRDLSIHSVTCSRSNPPAWLPELSKLVME